MSILVSCEHGGNEIPSEYQVLFSNFRSLLETHRGYDPGALDLSRRLASELEAPLLFSRVSRLLVDLNRSTHNPSIFSEVTRALPPRKKKALLQEFYYPYRRRIESAVREVTARGQCLFHLSVHTFTPFLKEERKADVALLYHPERRKEVKLAARWVDSMKEEGQGIRIRRNYPYRGTSDGVLSALRRQFSRELYYGIELEVNQRYPLEGGDSWNALQDLVSRTFKSAFFDS